jgi:hypothetical protein
MASDAASIRVIPPGAFIDVFPQLGDALALCLAFLDLCDYASFLVARRGAAGARSVVPWSTVTVTARSDLALAAAVPSEVLSLALLQPRYTLGHAELLHRVLPRMKHLQHLRVVLWSHSHASYATRTLRLVPPGQLRSLHLRDLTLAAPTGISALAALLRAAAPGLMELHLEGTNVGHHLAVGLADALGRLGALCRLSLRRSHFRAAEDLEALAVGLGGMPWLVALDLSYSHLPLPPRRSLSSLAGALHRSVPRLQILDLAALESPQPMLVAAAAGCQHLTVLRLVDCDLSSARHLPALLCGIVSSRGSLRTLALDNNPRLFRETLGAAEEEDRGGRSPIVMLVALLSALVDGLQHLHLDYTGLGESCDALDIAVRHELGHVLCAGRIVTLSLSRNPALLRTPLRQFLRCFLAAPRYLSELRMHRMLELGHCAGAMPLLRALAFCRPHSLEVLDIGGDCEIGAGPALRHLAMVLRRQALTLRDLTLLALHLSTEAHCEQLAALLRGLPRLEYLSLRACRWPPTATGAPFEDFVKSACGGRLTLLTLNWGHRG